MSKKKKDGNAIKENLAVYTTLRDELVQVEAMQRNVNMCMYATYAVIFALGCTGGLYAHFLLIVTFVSILPFQSIINGYNCSITRISIYIRVFFEHTRNDIHWESIHSYPPMKGLYDRRDHTVWGMISQTDSFQLGVLSTVVFAVLTAYKITRMGLLMRIVNLFLAGVILLLLAVCYRLNHAAANWQEEQIYDIMAHYKNDIETDRYDYRVK